MPKHYGGFLEKSIDEQGKNGVILGE